MGLIKAIAGAAGGVLADQWKEYFYCEALEAEVLMTKGLKRVSGRSSNTKGSDNIISNGSVIAVADGQCMIIVEQGKVVDLCAEPGEYVYDFSTEPSIFCGSLSQGIKDVFKNIGKRFTFGGEPPKDQRVYYFNTKELVGNKYGTAAPVPFRVVDARIGLDVDIAVRCFGEYSYRITNPILFYTNIAGNVGDYYTRENLDSQMKAELLTALQPAFAKISEMGIRYSAVPGHAQELGNILNEELSAKWRDLRGIEIVSFGVSSLKASEEDEKMIKELQRNAALRDPTMLNAHLAGAAASAMQTAAANENGAAMGFMGMGMVGNMGMGMAGNLSKQQIQAQQMMQQQQMNQQMGQQPTPPPAGPAGGVAPAAPAAPAADAWTCPACGTQGITGKFCPECGGKKPAPQIPFDANGWTCAACGTVNKGKFCAECGAKKPEGVPKYKCDKCGWEPADPTKPPKFCPECGDPFDENDLTT